MRALFCGSRTWDDVLTIEQALGLLPARCMVLSGGADGADHITEQLIRTKFPYLVNQIYRPNYQQYPGRYAPIARNDLMLDQLNPAVDLVFAFQRDGSRGTQHVINECKSRGLILNLFRYIPRREVVETSLAFPDWERVRGI